MEIYVLQGDKINPLENLIPFKYTVTGIEHKSETKGRTIIKVQYTYDTNGIIKVEARQDNSTSSLTVTREHVPEDMSKFSRPPEKIEVKPQTLNLVMAVDVSGSMVGKPLDDAKQAMCDFIEKLDFDYTRAAIMAVSDRTETVCSLSASKSRCIRAVNSIKCGQTGYENEAHPFNEIESLLADEEGRKFAIILADGVWERQDIAIKAARKCNNSGIETSGIGFGSADEKFLHDISSNDANVIFVQGSEDLGQAFGTIAQSLGGSSEIDGGGLTGLQAQDVQTWES